MWHPSFVQQWRETGGIGQELSWGFKTHWPYGPPVRGSLPCTLDSPCSGIWFSNPGQWVRYSGCRRRQEAEQMISTSQAICGTWASSSRQCFSCKGGSTYWHPTGLPALWAFLSVPGWEGEESCWSGPVQKVLLGKMDINRHAWKVECVFCCGRVQVEPQIIDFLKIVLQTTLVWNLEEDTHFSWTTYEGKFITTSALLSSSLWSPPVNLLVKTDRAVGPILQFCCF